MASSEHVQEIKFTKDFRWLVAETPTHTDSFTLVGIRITKRTSNDDDDSDTFSRGVRGAGV